MFLVQPYGLIILTAVVLGYSLFRRRVSSLSITPKQQETLLLFVLVFGLVGARLYHVLTEYYRYQGNWIQVLWWWKGGLGIYGAVLGAIAAGAIFSRRNQISLLLLLDAAVPCLLLGQSVGRLANVINEELLPFAWYDALLCLFLSAGIILLEGYFRFRLGSGKVTAGYLIGYGTGRFFLEMFRVPRLWLGLVSFTQLVSLMFVLVGIYLFKHLDRIFN
ncbi:prolipoprotein diacylglyceryl transferase [Patescibacteria group bacterium]|nr:prolipoprotein diacylglyceryl transferase [Patescibacteria group bacterium]MBU1868636.1 prolipoprotein diacylglyceryl transferase [Patescibacteria group bacterium]